MLNSFWNWFVIVLTVANILACWWLLYWTKGISGREDGKITTGHEWDGLTELNNPLPRWWLHLFNITIVMAIVYLILYPGLGNVKGILGWTQLTQYNDELVAAEATEQAVFGRFGEMGPEALMADAEAGEIGRRLFANSCAMCHGSDARGAPGFPNLTDNDWIWGNEYEQILTSITTGRVGTMPPWLAALGADGVNETTAYVQQLSGQDVDASLAAAGKARFDMMCVACHGPDATGNQALGAPDLTNGIWLYGGDAQTIAETISNGRAGKMPAHESLLNEQRRRVLAAYVKGLSGTGGQ
jgi:cytochrome c oxidase cbb3-type subunit 3